MVFTTVGLGTFIAVVDAGGINIALPTIAGHFNTDLPTVQWVSLGYALAISAFLLSAGRLADMFGRKEIYIAGLLIFGAGAALAGSAPSLWLLVVFRISSAIGAAMIMANGMAIFNSVFPASERGKAIGAHMSFVGSGMIFGPAFGGMLVEALGWRSIFFLSLPLVLGATVAAIVILDSRQLSQDRDEARSGAFDWLGAALSAGALLIFLVAMTNAHRVGWGSPVILVALVAAATLLGLFLWREAVYSFPMLDLGLFRRRTFSFGVMASFTAFVGSAAVSFLMPFYLQNVLGYSPARTGLVLMSAAIFMLTVAPISGRLSDRVGWKPFNIGGALLSAAGLFLVSRVTEDSGLGLIIPGLILHGAGMGMFHATNHSSILGAVPVSKYGIASAFVNLMRNTATTTGIAIATTVVVGTMASMGFEPSLEAVREGTQAGVTHAFTLGLRNIFLVAGGLQVAVMLVSLLKGKDADSTAGQRQEIAPIAAAAGDSSEA